MNSFEDQAVCPGARSTLLRWLNIPAFLIQFDSLVCFWMVWRNTLYQFWAQELIGTVLLVHVDAWGFHCSCKAFFLWKYSKKVRFCRTIFVSLSWMWTNVSMTLCGRPRSMQDYIRILTYSGPWAQISHTQMPLHGKISCQLLGTQKLTGQMTWSDI